MKKLLLTLVFSSALLIIGCRENSITDPFQETGFIKSSDPAVHSGTILLEGMLPDPHPVMNSYYIIKGDIQYQHVLKVSESIPYNPQYLISLDLSVTANFRYLCTVCEPQFAEISAGTVSIETSDNFYVSRNEIYQLGKTFAIQGREDGMYLKCRFHVTTDDIVLTEMWLELPDGTKQLIPDSFL